MVSATRDTAGQHAALRAAMAAERPDWHVDQVARASSGFEYPMHLGWHPEAIRELWRTADVVHLNLSLRAYREFDPGRHTPVVVHHHGSEYRGRKAEVDGIEREAGAVRVVSTLDLLGSHGVEWLPSVVDVERLRAMRRDIYRSSTTVRIVQTPTNRALKQTDSLLRAVRELETRLPVALDIVEGETWETSLARKARADIVVDQLGLGYGLSAVEAWAMGIPVVAGVQDATTRRRMVATFGALPFVDATPASLADRLEALVRDVALRREWAERGAEHVRRYHAQAPVVERLQGIYARAIALRP